MEVSRNQCQIPQLRLSDTVSSETQKELCTMRFTPFYLCVLLVHLRAYTARRVLQYTVKEVRLALRPSVPPRRS
jgi:hypothetical protein